MKKILNILMVLLLSACLIACSKKEEEKTKVSVALCQQSLLEGIPQALSAKFPDVDFEFTVANNTAKYYAYLADHNDLPDIITVRRFSLLDGLALKDDLVDLSRTEVASSYYQNFLNNYTFEDGTINWLPTTAEVWCIVANKTLFEENNIDIPTDYASFIEACKKFEELGIQGYTTDWSNDYSCLESLEGFNIEYLQSAEGKKWRSEYESGLTTTTTTDSDVWSSMFVKMEDMLVNTGNVGSNTETSEELVSRNFSTVQSMMDNRQVAMIRSSASEILGYGERNDDEFILLPYFGDENNWLLTYPNFQAAISSKSVVDQDLLIEIYSYLLGQECQDALNMGANAMSYNKSVEVEMNSYLSQLTDLIDSNYVFVRLANDSIFGASKSAVQGMITGEYDASSALAAFNEYLTSANKDVDMDLTIDTGYDYSFGENGSEAASAILNSCRQIWGSDLALTYQTCISNSIYAGEFSSSYVKYLIAGNYGANYYLTLPGSKIKDLVSAMLNYTADTNVGYNPLNDNMLPVSSGFEMSISKSEEGKYVLNKITINGEDIDETKEYTIVVSMPSVYASTIIGYAGIEIPDGSNKIVDSMIKTITAYLSENTSFVEPSKYITLD